ncbi:YadA-like family protein [Phascolarctobacterium succinatutens]|uniref:YadA-like family protein n=1 Tax=Phascolarctobacterium succinatutens TaxID=626940 RepID=UPI0026ED4CB1|nr:YadA-like family protein [Phascolarctobacterium succinatutens]
MKKTRKQPALAKCVLATIMAMGMMGYATVWAEDTVTPTPSPIDKSVSKDAAGQIYDASNNYHQGYFWTDLGHAQVKIGSGQQIELFTPFIYHTTNDQWKKGGTGWSPVHEGDNSEMECKESMSRITVGEFDRIIKSLYTNDITMAKTIYGEGDQAGLKDKVIKEVKATAGRGATVNTYTLVRENGTDVAVGIVDTDTKVVDNKLTFANGTLTSEITDNTGGTFASSVNGIASQEWVTNQLNGIGGTDTVTTAESGHAIITVVDANEALPTDNKHHVIGINEDALRGFIQDAAAAQDTNTTNTGMEGSLDGDGKLTLKVNDSAGNNVQAVVEDVASRSWVTGQLENVVDTNTTNTGMEGNLDEYGKLTVRVNDSDGKSVEASIEGVASRSWVTNQLENVADTNTITTVAVNTNILTIEDKGVDGNHAYELGINSEQLGDFVKQYDTNTITTVGADENGYVTVTEAPDPNQSGNHAYTVSFNEQKLIQTIEDQDRYVNGGSIGEDGSITLNVHNGRDVTLEGQMKDARLTDIERDKEAGTATLVVKDRYNPEEVNRLTIDDIASKEQNDRDHAEFREHFSELDHRVDSLGSRVDKVGAGAAALAALHPMDFDPDDKLTFAAGYGNYKGKNAAAVGAFYRPDEKVMLSVGGTFGNGENMVNAGISFSLDRTARVSNSRTAMAKEIVDLRANVANLTALVGQLTAGMGGTIEMDRMKLFPDVPENHWAYEYIGRLAAAGIIEGYPDGMFNGNRMMSRYEFAAMLYRALEKGVKLDHKLVREFEPEMGRIHVARISGADGDRGKIERVRVYGGDNRDHYGSKLN